MKPRRRICDQTDTPPAASAVELVPNVLGFLSFGAYQQLERGILTHGQPRFYTSSAQARRQGLLSTVGEILGSHWTATARLKLAAPSQIGAVPPQFVCLIGCMGLMDNTRQANCNHCTRQNKRKTQSPSTQVGHLECKDHDTWSIR